MCVCVVVVVLLTLCDLRSILIPQPGMEPMSLAVIAGSPNR